MRRRGALRLRAWLSMALAACSAGCATDSQVRAAITEVNETFRVEYERILNEKGSRFYPAKQPQAFAAVRGALGRLGMRIADESPEIGYLNVSAPAPNPLNAQEWRLAADADLPTMRDIATRHVGIIGRFLRFEPEGLDIVINAAAIDSGAAASEVSLTMRMRETSPPPSGMPRREYPPPTAVRMGLDKIWREVERELGPARRNP
jgi:hypothetical protein